jgi:hypothetical protein
VKFVEPSQFADPDVAARKLVEIANGIEAVQDGRIYIELVNGPFLKAGATPDQYRAALAHAVSEGWLWLHESGTYVKFTLAGADMIAGWPQRRWASMNVRSDSATSSSST